MIDDEIAGVMQYTVWFVGIF